jgi:hypothetical protein
MIEQEPDIEKKEIVVRLKTMNSLFRESSIQWKKHDSILNVKSNQSINLANQ